jgi:altronate dehydratase
VSAVAALVISPHDNVATALQSLEPGQVVEANGQSVTIAEATPKGHKIALRLIRAGEQVMKYGSTIGTATCDIKPGEHVHTHNVASSRGRGDLRADTTADAPRLAEPPDWSPVTGKTAQ